MRPHVHGRAVGAARARARPRQPRPHGVGVRALQRAHRPAREPRRGRAVRPPRHLPQRLLRDPPAAVRGGRLRQPGGRPDARRRHQRQADPPARRRRAVRHPLRRAAAPRAAAGHARRRAHPRGRVALADRRRRARAHDAARVVHAALGRGDPLRGRAARGAHARRRAERAGGQRAGAGARPRTRARRPRSPPRWSPRSTPPTTCAPCSCTSRAAARLRMAAGMDHVIEGPEGWVFAAESRDDLGRITITADIEPGQPLQVDKLLAYGWSSVRSLPSVRDQVDAALAAAAQVRLGRAWRRSSAPTWTSSGSNADVELDGDLELQQAVRFSIFHAMQAGARAEQRAIPAKGLTGPGYDGHSFWDSESFVLPLLTYTVPDAAADALRWRWSTLDLAVERAAHAAPRRRRVPVAHDPRAGVLGLLAGGHGGLPHQRGHRGRGRSATCRRRATRSSSAPSGSSCWCRRRGCGARSATTTPRAPSTSTASRAPTSTPRSSTTTSTRT